MSLNKTEALRHAQQFALQGNLTSAITVYEKIVAADPADLAALSALGDLYVKAHRAPEAIEKFSRIAESCLERGSAVHAAYYLRKALEIEPANAPVRMRLGEIYSHEGLAEKAHEAFVQAGVAFRQSGNLAEAMAANQQALTVKANSRLATEAIVMLQREMAEHPARPAPGRTMDQAPHDLLMEFDALNAMRASRSLNDSAGVRKAPPLGEEQVVERISTAELLVAYGQVDDAVAMLRKVLELKPGDVNVHIKLKDIYLRSEMTEAAAEECLEISRIYAAHGDAERARDYVIRAQRLIPAYEAKGAMPIAKEAAPREPAESFAATPAGDAPAVTADAESHDALTDSSAPSAVEIILPALPTQPAVAEAAAVIEITFAAPSVDEQATAQPTPSSIEQATAQPAQSIAEEAPAQLVQPVIEEAVSAQLAQTLLEEVTPAHLAQTSFEEMIPAPQVQSPAEATTAAQTVQSSVEEMMTAPPAPVTDLVAVTAPPLIDAVMLVTRDETPMPALAPEDHAVAASDLTGTVVSDAAPALLADAASVMMATTATTAATTMTKEQPGVMVVAAAGGKSRRGLYAVALLVGLLTVAASVAIPIYKSHRNQKPEVIAQQIAPPAASSELSGESQPAAVTPQPVEQVEVRASDPPAAGVDKPARIEKDRSEKNVTEVPYVEPPAKPAPELTRLSVSPNANKPAVLAPPRVASAPNAQGGAESAAPRGESASLPRSATGLPEPPPPPTAQKPSVITPSQSAHTVQPEYPQLAKATRQAGMVVVEVAINERGDVTAARALSGPPLLRDAALSAARRWKFKPAMRDGKPIGSTSTLSFNFKM